MSRVNRFPLGFLDLLGAVTQGKTPPDFSEVLAGTVDMTEFYASGLLGSYVLSSAHTGPITLSFDHDDSEVWVLRGCGFSTPAAVAAGTFEQWTLSAGPTPINAVGSADPTASVPIWASEIRGATTNGDVISDATTFPVPFVIPPGVDLTASLNQRDGGASRTTTFALLLSILQR